MHDKMCDSMRYLYDKDDCTFSILLKASMIAEAESRARHTVKSKAAHVVEVPTNPADSELTSIQNQLDSMTKILKSAQFNKKVKRERMVRRKEPNLLKLNCKPSQRGLLHQQQDRLQGVNSLSNAIIVWDGGITNATAQTGSLFKEVLNGETCMGRWC